jgi:hypothetical protein
MSEHGEMLVCLELEFMWLGSEEGSPLLFMGWDR